MTEIGTCPHCGRRLENVLQKYCSNGCALAAKRDYQLQYQRERRQRQRADALNHAAPSGCLICGGTVAKPRLKYCSDECYAVASGRRSQEVAEMVRRGEHVRQAQGPRGLYRSTRQKQRRECLKCGNVFLSRGPGNRLCPTCREKNNNWLRHGGNEDMIYAAALVDWGGK